MAPSSHEIRQIPFLVQSSQKPKSLGDRMEEMMEGGNYE
jgi:hypothetical protein